jgi:hypothetical protein
VNSGLRREVDKNFPLLCHYTTYSGNFLQTFRENISVQSSRIKNVGPIVLPETSVRNYHYTLSNIAEEGNSQIQMNLEIGEYNIKCRKNKATSFGQKWLNIIMPNYKNVRGNNL